MISDDETRDQTERLREALDERSARKPGTLEFDQAQQEVDRLVVEFVEQNLDPRRSGQGVSEGSLDAGSRHAGTGRG